MNYTIDDLGDIVRISIPTNTSWGTILFAWEKSNDEFTTAMESKGIDVLVDLLVNNPNTAYNQFING
jgi:hypothetical protein